MAHDDDLIPSVVIQSRILDFVTQHENHDRHDHPMKISFHSYYITGWTTIRCTREIDTHSESCIMVLWNWLYLNCGKSQLSDEDLLVVLQNQILCDKSVRVIFKSSPYGHIELWPIYSDPTPLITRFNYEFILKNNEIHYSRVQ